MPPLASLLILSKWFWATSNDDDDNERTNVGKKKESYREWHGMYDREMTTDVTFDKEGEKVREGEGKLPTLGPLLLAIPKERSAKAS